MPELVELEKAEDIQLLKALIARYHRQGAPKGGAAAGHHRFFVLVEEGYWVAGAWLHDNTPFRFIAQRFMIGSENSYFIRRICKFAPGDWLIALLKLLADKLKKEGKECIWTLGLDDHSNALYKRAGFVEVGRTPRTGHPVFVLRLR
ncbi:MAG: hypothetical protein LM580_04935 [Thermofilum sp.]|nr:hypothetical protein [Thermofilum sp.]